MESSNKKTYLCTVEMMSIHQSKKVSEQSDTFFLPYTRRYSLFVIRYSLSINNYKSTFRFLLKKMKVLACLALFGYFCKTKSAKMSQFDRQHVISKWDAAQQGSVMYSSAQFHDSLENIRRIIHKKLQEKYELQIKKMAADTDKSIKDLEKKYVAQIDKLVQQVEDLSLLNEALKSKLEQKETQSITIKKAAEMLLCSAKHVRTLMAKGLIKGDGRKPNRPLLDSVLQYKETKELINKQLNNE